MRNELDSYFGDTEPAVRHMFAALQEYDAQTVPPSLGRYADQRGVVTMSRDQGLDYMKELSCSLALDFAKATLCGSIAQVAYVALKQYSRNEDVDSACAALGVLQASSATKFCVGRRIHGIPLGLLVYAARVQYNHWEEGTPTSAVPKAVLEALYRHYSNDLTFDMAYVLDWPSPRPVAHYILRHELRWMSYGSYVNDLRQALESAPA